MHVENQQLLQGQQQRPQALEGASLVARGYFHTVHTERGLFPKPKNIFVKKTFPSPYTSLILFIPHAKSRSFLLTYLVA